MPKDPQPSRDAGAPAPRGAVVTNIPGLHTITLHTPSGPVYIKLLKTETNRAKLRISAPHSIQIGQPTPHDPS